jgi:hypothetical protein
MVEDISKKQVKRRPGQPTKYNLQLATEICNAIASSHHGLFELCEQNPHWPPRSCIFLWLRKYKEFTDMYTKAKEDQTEVCVEYMQSLMNEPHKHYDEELKRDVCDIGMMRLKSDAIKWQTAKLKPRKYGEAKQEEIVSQEIHQDSIKRKKDMDEKYKKEY